MGKFAKISIILFITLLPTNSVFADENEGNFTGGTKNSSPVGGNLNEVKSI